MVKEKAFVYLVTNFGEIASLRSTLCQMGVGRFVVQKHRYCQQSDPQRQDSICLKSCNSKDPEIQPNFNHTLPDSCSVVLFIMCGPIIIIIIVFFPSLLSQPRSSFTDEALVKLPKGSDVIKPGCKL